MEKMRIDIYNLKKTDIILNILWLQVHNPKINQKMGKVKITRCPLIYRKKIVIKKNIERKKKVKRKIRIIKKSNRDK